MSYINSPTAITIPGGFLLRGIYFRESMQLDAATGFVSDPMFTARLKVREINNLLRHARALSPSRIAEKEYQSKRAESRLNALHNAEITAYGE